MLDNETHSLITEVATSRYTSETHKDFLHGIKFVLYLRSLDFAAGDIIADRIMINTLPEDLVSRWLDVLRQHTPYTRATPFPKEVLKVYSAYFEQRMIFNSGAVTLAAIGRAKLLRQRIRRGLLTQVTRCQNPLERNWAPKVDVIKGVKNGQDRPYQLVRQYLDEMTVAGTFQHQNRGGMLLIRNPSAAVRI